MLASGEPSSYPRPQAHCASNFCPHVLILVSSSLPSPRILPPKAAIRALEGTGLDVAGRVNQISCIFGASAASLLYFAILTWFTDGADTDSAAHSQSSGGVIEPPVREREGHGGLSAACALLAAGLFAASPRVWDASTHAEVKDVPHRQGSEDAHKDIARDYHAWGPLVGFETAYSRTDIPMILVSCLSPAGFRAKQCAVLPAAALRVEEQPTAP